MTCYDCGVWISERESVLEERQVSGGDGVTYAGDFKKVPVHADRRICHSQQEKNRSQANKEGKMNAACLWNGKFRESRDQLSSMFPEVTDQELIEWAKSHGYPEYRP